MVRFIEISSMHHLPIVFSFVAVISLPKMIAGAPREDLETEETSPVGNRWSFGAWWQGKRTRIYPGHTISPPASLSSLPLDVRRV